MQRARFSKSWLKRFFLENFFGRKNWIFVFGEIPSCYLQRKNTLVLNIRYYIRYFITLVLKRNSKSKDIILFSFNSFNSYCCISVLVYYCTTVPLYYCTIVLVYQCTTVPLYYCTSVLMYYCTTVPLYYCTTVLLNRLVYYCTAVLVYYIVLLY